MKILYADDNPNLQTAMKQILNMSNYDVDIAVDGEQAWYFATSNTYDCIILDVMMPKMDGIQVLKKIRERGIQTPVIILTAKSQIEDKIEGLDNGADDYITKPFFAKELLARIRALLRRNVAIIETLNFGNTSLDPQTFEIKNGTKSLKLTRKEFQLLEYLIRHQKMYVSTQKLLDDVWDSDTESFIETVWVFISNLRKKLTAIESNVKIKASRDIGYRVIVEDVQ